MANKKFRLIAAAAACGFLCSLFCAAPDAVAKMKKLEASEDGLWLGGEAVIYDDFQPKEIEQRKKNAVKAAKKQEKETARAAEKNEKEKVKAAKNEEKAAKKRQKNEQKDHARAAKYAANEKKQKPPKEKRQKYGKAGSGKVTAADFAYKGLPLGASYSEMVKKLGEPDFHRDYIYYGSIRVRYYVYGRELRVGMAGSPEKVVDIMVEDDKYKVRGDVRFGSTVYYIGRVFGNTERVRMGNKLYMIYENPDAAHQRLLFDLDPSNESLRAWRYTLLPLDGREADLRFNEFSSPALLKDFAPLIKAGEIDTSNVTTQQSAPKINVGR